MCLFSRSVSRSKIKGNGGEGATAGGAKLSLIECRSFSGTPCTYSGGLLHFASCETVKRRVKQTSTTGSTFDEFYKYARSFSIHRCLMYSIRLCAERFDLSMRERERVRERKERKRSLFINAITDRLPMRRRIQHR